MRKESRHSCCKEDREGLSRTILHDRSFLCSKLVKQDTPIHSISQLNASEVNEVVNKSWKSVELVI